MSRDVLQPRQVTPQVWLAVQVDVERADVETVEVEELGGRKVDVGQQAFGRRRLEVVIERLEKALDS